MSVKKLLTDTEVGWLVFEAYQNEIPSAVMKTIQEIYGKINQALAELENCSECEQHRWIPVSKGLPKKGQFCHLYMPEFNSNCPQKGWYSPDKKVWTTLVRSYCRTRKVTHGKPIILPKEVLKDKP